MKSANILIDPTGDIKICDFGSATVLFPSVDYACVHAGGCDACPRVMSLVGTDGYQAPEMLRMYESDACDSSSSVSKGYTSLVDWWALGVIVREMLCGFDTASSISGGNVIRDVNSEVVGKSVACSDKSRTPSVKSITGHKMDDVASLSTAAPTNSKNIQKALPKASSVVVSQPSTLSSTAPIPKINVNSVRYDFLGNLIVDKPRDMLKKPTSLSVPSEPSSKPSSQPSCEPSSQPTASICTNARNVGNIGKSDTTAFAADEPGAKTGEPVLMSTNSSSKYEDSSSSGQESAYVAKVTNSDFQVLQLISEGCCTEDESNRFGPWNAAALNDCLIQLTVYQHHTTQRQSSQTSNKIDNDKGTCNSVLPHEVFSYGHCTGRKDLFDMSIGLHDLYQAESESVDQSLFADF